MRAYANFNGRARRKEFWMFVLFSCIIMYLFLAVWAIAGGFNYDNEFLLDLSNDPFALWRSMFASAWYYYAISLVFLLPGLAVTVRRLHDTGRSGWMLGLYWLVYACMIGIIVGMFYSIRNTHGILLWIVGGFPIYLRGFAFILAFLVWLCLPGDRGTNPYGIDPKAANR